MPTPSALEAAFEHCRVQLAAVAPRDWDVMVPGMERTARDTIEHLVDVLGFYMLHLLAESPRRLRVDLVCHRGISNDAVLDVLAAEVRGLARVAAWLPASTRAYHFHGMADVPGFVAMACAELMVHSDDACRALGVRFDADDDVAGDVVDRLFPWSAGELDPWSALRWSTGRIAPEGREVVGDDWAYHAAPLAEWDGVRSTGVVSLDGYVFEPGSARWVAAPA